MGEFHKYNGRLKRKLGRVGKCAYCGKEKSSSLDHIIPLAVYKWTGIGDLKDYNSKDNTVLSCEDCNYEKGCSVPRRSEVLRIKPSCIHIYDKLHVAIEKYNHMIYALLNKQHYRCLYCKASINYKTAVIRRRYSEHKRTFRNAVLVCYDCSYQWHYIRSIRKRRS